MMLIFNKTRLPALLLMLLAGMPPGAGQKGQSMEERLRAELRNVTAQLQQTRGELEMLKARAPLPPRRRPWPHRPATP
jgi:hypothetical protein